MQWNYVFKYTGTVDEFKIHFFNAINKFNEDYPSIISPVFGKINENKIEIGIEVKNNSEGYWFISPIQSKNGELRFEGVLSSNVNRPFLISLVHTLFLIVLLPLKIVVWIVKKVFGLPIKLSKHGKLSKLMINYIGCEPSLLIETEKQVDEIKQYLTNNKKFTGAIDAVSRSALKIEFNEYLRLDIYLENQYDEAYVEINDGFTHWHPMNKEVLKEIIDIVEGKIFFIQPRGISRIIKLNGLTIIYNEKEIHKYLGKKNIRIYNNQIIQRSRK